jgi:hypothetical protein
VEYEAAVQAAIALQSPTIVPLRAG